MHAEPEITVEDEVATSTKNRLNNWQRGRIAIGVITLLLIVFEFVAAESDVNNASDADASAIQIVQVWTPHLFYMMTIIGVSIAFYIITRVVE